MSYKRLHKSKRDDIKKQIHTLSVRLHDVRTTKDGFVTIERSFNCALGLKHSKRTVKPSKVIQSKP